MTTKRRPNRWIQAVQEQYHMARITWEQMAEAACGDYTTERAEWEAENPPPTFREFLVGMAGTVA